jgi:hypothetical protein
MLSHKFIFSFDERVNDDDSGLGFAFVGLIIVGLTFLAKQLTTPYCFDVY